MVDTAGRPFVVRHYYRMLARHPAFTNSLFGRGVVVLSERGRARFAEFPSVLADDFFLDSLFPSTEKRVVSEVVSVVGAPSTAKRPGAAAGSGTPRQPRSPPVRHDSAPGARRVRGVRWLLDAVRSAPTFALIRSRVRRRDRVRVAASRLRV